MYRKFFVFVMVLFLVNAVFASYLHFDFQNNYAKDGNFQLKVYVGADLINYDINVLVYKDDSFSFYSYKQTEQHSDGNYAYFNLDYNINGDLNKNGADYNIVIKDLNDNIQKNIYLFIPGFRDLDINWRASPPFSLGQDVNFNFVYFDENGTEVSYDGNYKVSLYFEGNFVNSYDVSGTNTIHLNSTDINRVGKYFIVVGDENRIGYKTFSFEVKAFTLIAFVSNHSERGRKDYTTEDNLSLIILGLDENHKLLRLDDINYYIDGSKNRVSSIRLKNSISLGQLSEGHHSFKVDASKDGNVQSVFFDIFVSNYVAVINMFKNSVFKSQEKIKGAFPPNKEIRMQYYVLDRRGNLQDMNNNDNCNKLLKEIKYVKIGLSNYKSMSFTTSYDNNKCVAHFKTPNVGGKYNFIFDLNESMYERINDPMFSLVVKRYFVDLIPVDVTNVDSPKFMFFDENIGLKYSIFDLNGSSGDLNIVGINKIKMYSDDYGISELGSSDYSFDKTNNFINIDKDAVPSGEFDVFVEFDTNEGIYKAHTHAIKKTYKISVDLNGENSLFGGEPFVRPDENVVLKITAKTSSGASVSYADVYVEELIRLNDTNDLIAYADETSAVTNSNGIAYINLGTLPLGLYKVKVKVDNGAIDYGFGYFRVRSFSSFALSMGDNHLEEYYRTRDQNVNLCVFVLEDLGMGGFVDNNEYTIPSTYNLMIKRINEGRMEDVSDVNLVSAGTCTWTIRLPDDTNEDRNGVLVRPIRTGGFETGDYIISFDVNYDGNIDQTIGFFNIMPFSLQICDEDGESCGESFEEPPVLAKPNDWLDLNIKLREGSAQDVNIVVSIINDRTGELVETDLNYYYDNDSANLKPTLHASTDGNLIHIKLPDIDVGEYNLIFDVNNGTDKAILHKFILAKHFLVNVVSMEGRIAQYSNDWLTGGLDTNILDNSINGCSDINVGNIDYNYFIVDSDFNRLMLIDILNNIIYIDLDNDCNFMNNLSDGKIYLRDHNILDVNIDNNMPTITNLNHAELTYMLYNADTSINTDTKEMFSNFVGEFDLDRNFYIPIVVGDVNGSPLEDVNVQVYKLFRMDFFTQNRTLLQEGIDYNVYIDNNTDENGVVFIKFKVASTGDFLMVLKLNKDGNEQILMPWEAPAFSVKMFNGEISLSRDHRIKTTGDYNYGFVVDVNNFNTTLFGHSLYAIFNETTYNLDHDSNTNEIWYIVNDDSDLIIDDDTNIDPNDDSSNDAGVTLLSSNIPSCIGNYNGSENDCNQDSNFRNAFVKYDLLSSYDINVNYALNSEMDLNILDDKNMPFYFDDANNGPIGNSEVKGISNCNIFNLDGNCIKVYVKDIPAGNNAIGFQQLVPATNEICQNYTWQFEVKSELSSGTDQNIMLMIASYDDSIGENKYYNWLDGNWTDIGQQGVRKIVTVSGGNKTTLTFDFNTCNSNFPESSLVLMVAIPYSSNDDYQMYFDNFYLKQVKTAKKIRLYNSKFYYQKPSNLNVRMDWVIVQDLNLYPDENHILELSIKNRDFSDVSAQDINADVDIIRTDCDNEFGFGTLLGNYQGMALDNNEQQNVWLFNLGDFNSLTEDCYRMIMKANISMEKNGNVYNDTLWRDFFVMRR